MAKDPRVESAISHWAPRFISNGVLLADFEEVTAGVDRWEDWCSAWSARAAFHESLGREALEQGYKLSAGEHLSRAAVYYHFAKFVFVHDLDQMRTAHMKAVECRLALPHLKPPGERVEFPTRADTWQVSCAARRLQQTSRRHHGSGLDSAKEEMEA